MYLADLGIKDTTESNTSASYLDLLLSIGDGQLHIFLHDKLDDLNFNKTDFPFLLSNSTLRQPMVCLSHSSYGMPGLV